jgi:phosphatidylserine decarboxylase
MIQYYNRDTKDYEIEQVAGEAYLKWIYSSPIGLGALELFVKRKLFSKLYGIFCDTNFSKRKIDKFIKEFSIDMQLCQNKQQEFNSFNDFFSRRLVEKARIIDKEPSIVPSPGDGRLLAFENIDMERLVQVKGITYRFEELIGDNKLAGLFSGGTCLILRLCPTDYHRFHFVDNGVCGQTNKVKGEYYSVNPVALNKIPGLFCRNKREWSVFKSENFGDILYVEVGATCVGSIIQTYAVGSNIKKGEEKGYFKFGGSTTILFFQKNKVKIDKDILEQTTLGFETKVVMGETIGKRIDFIEPSVYLLQIHTKNNIAMCYNEKRYNTWRYILENYFLYCSSSSLKSLFSKSITR